MQFNREKGFDEEGYVKVNERLQEFWQRNPQGSLQTEKFRDEYGTTFKARLYRNLEEAKANVPFATGHAFLPKHLNDEKVEEFTETVSVGRALALAGYKVTKSIASAEEMKRFYDNKKVAPPTAQEEGGSDNPSDPLPKLKSSNKFNMNKIKKDNQAN